MFEAYKNRDERVLQEILAQDFIFTDEAGGLYTKAQYIDAVMNAGAVKSYQLDDITARLYGDTGVIGARWRGQFTMNGKDVPTSV